MARPRLRAQTSPPKPTTPSPPPDDSPLLEEVISDDFVVPKSQHHTSLRRRVKWAYFFLIFLFATRYQWPDHASMESFLRFCQFDHQMCPVCFDNETLSCHTLASRVKINATVTNFLNGLFHTGRFMQYGLYQNESAVIKYVVYRDLAYEMHRKVCELLVDRDMNCDAIWYSKEHQKILRKMLIKHYIEFERTTHIKVLPLKSVSRFLRVFGQNYSNEVIPILQLNTNPEPMLMHTLHAHGFPVPRVLMECGLVVVPSYEGNSLQYYFGSPFRRRVQIAKHMLETALLFTEGIEGFRIYITDATADNIVVNSDTMQVSIVDLDTVVVVDTKTNPFRRTNPRLAAEWPTVHRSEVIECPGCFAFSEDMLQQHHNSDHNIYAICSMFIQDLQGDPTRGLLHSVPNSILIHFDKFLDVLLECMRCAAHDCINRFAVANELIGQFEQILELT